MSANIHGASLHSKTRRADFLCGMRDGIPIGAGYFAVSFSLGIAARSAGMNPVQCFLVSMLCNASAGEYAGISLIAVQASYPEIALMTLIANARYLLMSTALSQRIRPGTSMLHRLALSFDITDELFAIAIARQGYVSPYYSYGSYLVALPCWASGTAMGCIAGNLLPARLVSSLGVSLFGMFLAIIVPAARKDRVIAVLIALSFAMSYAAGVLPVIRELSGGTRTIILTVFLSAAAAYFFPHEPDA